MNAVSIYTDGSCRGAKAGGHGGWGWIVAGTEEQGAGREANTTSNRMELTAILKALYEIGLARLRTFDSITIYSDSAYAVNMFKLKWVNRWEKTNWTGREGKILNLDLIQPIWFLVRQLPHLKFEWVKAHSGDHYNEIADGIATGQADIQLRENGLPTRRESYTLKIKLQTAAARHKFALTRKAKSHRLYGVKRGVKGKDELDRKRTDTEASGADHSGGGGNASPALCEDDSQ